MWEGVYAGNTNVLMVGRKQVKREWSLDLSGSEATLGRVIHDSIVHKYMVDWRSTKSTQSDLPFIHIHISIYCFYLFIRSFRFRKSSFCRHRWGHRCRHVSTPPRFHTVRRFMFKALMIYINTHKHLSYMRKHNVFSQIAGAGNDREGRGGEATKCGVLRQQNSSVEETDGVWRGSVGGPKCIA